MYRMKNNRLALEALPQASTQQTLFFSVLYKMALPKCYTCQNSFSEELDFMGSRRRYTDRFAEMVVKQVAYSDMHNVALQYDLTDEEVWSMVQYVSKKNKH